MQELIASYLFQNRSCSIPGLGNLTLNNTGAVSDFTNKKILAPLPVIHFENKETLTGSLLEYITKRNNCNVHEAAAALGLFSENLKNEMAKGSGAKLEGIGNLLVDPSGEIIFRQTELPPEFLPPAEAEWVIHQATEHTIRVGDKESTNTEMTEYYNVEPVAKDRWWIWAIILCFLGIATILFYFNDTDASSLFGNTVKF